MQLHDGELMALKPIGRKPGDGLRCFELFALRHGEQLFIGRSTNALLMAEIIPRDILTGQNIGWVEGAGGIVTEGEEEPSSYSRQPLNGLEETEEGY